MRILHLTVSIANEAGGVARTVQDTSKSLAQEGLTVEILTHRSGTLDLPWKDSPPPGLTLTMTKAACYERFVSAEMKRILPERIKACDILHVHGMWQTLNNRATSIARKLRKPYVCSIHGMLDPWSMSQRRRRKLLYYHLFEKSRLEHAAAIHFTAEDELRKAIEWVPAGVPTPVIPVIMNLAMFMELPERGAGYRYFPQVPANVPWVLFLSRIHAKKGLEYLIEAMVRLPAGLGSAQLVVAGTGEPGYVESLKALAKRLGIEARVHFVGLVQGATKTALYRTADVLAIPTSQENFGLIFPEALACETAVMLTTGVDIHREILAAGAGYLIRQDAADIAEKLTAALGDRPANRQRGEAGRRWVLANLAPATIAKRWRGVYESILAGTLK